jgi:hypothetical protein
MAATKRRLVKMEKKIIRDDKDQPRWLVMHYAYSDGGEVHEVRPLEGGGESQRFATESELDSWLRAHKGARVA